MSAAAQKAQALLDEWRRTCKEPDVMTKELDWKERLQHQISAQQNQAILATMTSMEYAR